MDTLQDNTFTEIDIKKNNITFDITDSQVTFKRCGSLNKQKTKEVSVCVCVCVWGGGLQ